MKVLKNAIIIPLEGTMDSFTGGVFSSDGQFLEDSLLDRGKAAPLQEPVEALQGVYIYGGCLFGHFGHFIWESLSRLYAIRQCKNYPIIFTTPNDNRIIPFAETFLKAIGVNNKIQLIRISTSVENLIYSLPKSSLKPLFIEDEQVNALKSFHFQKDNHNIKIWLSRSMLKYGKIDNEQVIEEELRKNGYEIICPQNFPLREQVRLISTSDIVAGCDGSAFFSLLFANEIYGKFIVFNRRRDIAKSIPYAFKKRNVLFEQYTFELEPINEKWPVAIFHHPDP
ncbi:MAG: glycosyltransferase family 61 protein, partial [Desulfovibrio sp.]|nr:glycosyltransferase family 61 protein [Desulfovibrio sp.]